jgi:hypothetical protein
MNTVMNNFPMEAVQLARYLAGYPEYAIVNRYGNTPTDPTLAVRPIIQKIRSEINFLDSLYEALQILAEDPKYGWMVMYYVAEIAWTEKRLGLKLIRPESLLKIGNSLNQNKETLECETGFDGEEFEHGVWNDVVRMNSNISDKYGIEVIPVVKLGQNLNQ